MSKISLGALIVLVSGFITYSYSFIQLNGNYQKRLSITIIEKTFFCIKD